MKNEEKRVIQAMTQRRRERMKNRPAFETEKKGTIRKFFIYDFLKNAIFAWGRDQNAP